MTTRLSTPYRSTWISRTIATARFQPWQLASVGAGEILFIDTRSPDQYESGHIPDARNIEWREVLTRKEEIPMDKTVVLYCDTGLLSAKAHFALRLAGYENLKVLQGGYLMWSQEQDSKEMQTKGEN